MSKSPIIVSLVLLLILATDYLTRLSPEVDSSVKREIDTSREPLKINILTQDSVEALQSRLAKYDVEKKPEPVEPQQKAQISKPKVYIMPEDEQRNQQGKLDQLFDDKYKYVLRATFNNDGERFAVLERHDLEALKMEKITMKLGDALAGYRSQEIGNTYIKLKKDERIVELRLFIHKVNA
jgi:hypothetical protein